MNMIRWHNWRVYGSDINPDQICIKIVKAVKIHINSDLN